MKLKVKKKAYGINLVSMPDVAFLLLIFLILTTSVDEQGDIDLPSFRFRQEADFPETVSISASETGQFLFLGDPVDEQEIPGLLRQVPSDRVVHLIADKNIPYAEVDGILGMVQDAGLQDVVLIMDDSKSRDTTDVQP